MTHVLIVPQWYPSSADPVTGCFVRDQALAAARHHRVTVLGHEDAQDGPLTVLRRLPQEGTVARARALLRATAELRPDVLHAHVFSAGFLAVLAGLRHRLPVVVSEHHTDFVAGRMPPRALHVARLTLRAARCVCPVSELLERALRPLAPRARYEVVPNVIDVAPFAGAARPARRGRRLVAVGSDQPHKGLDLLLRAVDLVPDVELEIVGMEGTHPRVRFLGRQPRAAVVEALGRADALVMPSRADAFGIAAVEGLAAGLPVLTTDGAGSADVVRAQGGVVVPAGDVPALADGIRRVLAVPAPAGAAAALERDYGQAAVAARWERVYGSL